MVLRLVSYMLNNFVTSLNCYPEAQFEAKLCVTHSLATKTHLYVHTYMCMYVHI